MPVRKRDLLILLAASIAIAGAMGALAPFSTPDSRGRIAFLEDIIAGRSIASAPYPLGYVGFAGLLIRAGGIPALIAGQATLYVLGVLLSYETLWGLGLRGGGPLWGALTVAAYPNLFLAITRFQDTGMSCFLLLLFAWLVTRLKHDGFSLPNAVMSGLLFGVMLLVRPNGISLAPIALWAGCYGRRPAGTQVAQVAAAAAIAFATLAAVLLPAKGRLVVFDRYQAAYTFCNGTHEHALEGTLQDYNGERTMSLALEEHGLKFAELEQTTPALADEYIAFAWSFIRDHPLRYAALELVKILNLFRPDYRNVQRSFTPPAMGVIAHTAIAGLFFVWAVLRWRCRHLMGLNEGLILAPMLVLYLAPFVAMNSDPRYRVHVDSLFILESIFCLSLLRNFDRCEVDRIRGRDASSQPTVAAR